VLNTTVKKNLENKPAENSDQTGRLFQIQIHMYEYACAHAHSHARAHYHIHTHTHTRARARAHIHTHTTTRSIITWRVTRISKQYGKHTTQAAAILFSQLRTTGCSVTRALNFVIRICCSVFFSVLQRVLQLDAVSQDF